MSERKRNCTTDFKRKAVGLSCARGSMAQARRELDVPSSVLGRWRSEFGEHGREVANLKKQLKDMQLIRT